MPNKKENSRSFFRFTTLNSEHPALAVPLVNAGASLRTPNSRGFTLIEVLLALSILAVTLTVVYASFSTSAQNIQRAEEKRDDTDLARTLIARLTDDISNAYCTANLSTTFFYGKDKERDAENGDRVRADTLYFTTLTNAPAPDSKESELWEVGYFFREKADGEGYALFRSEKRDVTEGAQPLDGIIEYEISDRVRGLRFRYFDGTKLVDEWDKKTGCNPATLPASVEIAITLDSGETYLTQVMHEKLKGN